MKKKTVSLGKKTLANITKVSPSLGCYILFLLRTHRIPNLKNPKDFNEKMTFLKLNYYSNNELVSKCTDKLLVREYVKLKKHGDILNELHGVYNNFQEIDFETLPQKFALKCNHGCAYNVICKDKSQLNIALVKKNISKWMKERYGYATQEFQYTKIRPKIICEKYLSDQNDLMPIDYKFYCFNGSVKTVMVCTDRESRLKLNYYDTDWAEVPYGKKKWRNNEYTKKPRNLKNMIKIAEDLSDNFPFVRVDLYDNKGKIVFGELTFTPACCCAPYYSVEGLDILGNYLKLDGYIS